jgi:hypothetical protein
VEIVEQEEAEWSHGLERNAIVRLLAAGIGDPVSSEIFTIDRPRPATVGTVD